MNRTYTTSEVARIIKIHPNTVRLYEELSLITKPKRKENGYRIFTDLHIEQFRAARLAFQVEILQNGLRKRAVEIIKAFAKCEFDRALDLTELYLDQLRDEKLNAEKAVQIAEKIISGSSDIEQSKYLKRKEAADYLHVSIDVLRNWEMNGLLNVKRKENGYRIYTAADIRRLIIVKSLRCANYSLSSILHMINILSEHPQMDIYTAIDASQSDDEVISACDNLLKSLNYAENNAKEISTIIKKTRKLFNANPPL